MDPTDNLRLDLFAANLYAYRVRAGLTRYAVAKALHTSPTTVTRWEEGRGYPSLPMLLALAATLAVSVSDLCENCVPLMKDNPNGSLARLDQD